MTIEKCSSSKRQLIFFWVGVCLLFALDYASKQWAISSISKTMPNIIIDGTLNFQLAHNKGAAWSLLSSHPEWVGLISLIFCLALSYYATFKLPQYKLQKIGLALILSGALGNLLDRLSLGYVIDFIDLELIPNYPIFNLADCFIVSGITLVIFYIIFSPHHQHKD